MDEDKMLYSNKVEIFTSSYDIIFEFSRTIPAKNEKDEINYNTINLIRLAMSPQLAKNFHQLLGDQIQTYETNIGKINFEQKSK